MPEITSSIAQTTYVPGASTWVDAERHVQRPGTIRLGGLPITVVDRAEAARRMVEEALARRGTGLPPQYLTSANGQVLVECARDEQIRDLFLQADAIHADGMPMVYASWQMATIPLPERVATTDLVHDVMKLSGAAGLRSFLLGATAEANAAAVAKLRVLYPDVPEIDGRDGYFSEDEEAAVCEAVNAYAPDVLWLGLGVPKEQAFVARNRHRLTRVGVIKTSGGLFDFLSGKRARAPKLVQALGFEWAWRAMLEPRRLGKRYLDTNFAAMRLLLTETD
ncbi:WecB/TagA/CpsF family glycosyltransferase [Pinisolibacter sp.]|uniref:WecB/TagA/CpsF family glycosyltransferase n=1 Tax=Pinisolibacter sp. TaxID=2172024 RepID=UPI002FDD8C4A